MTEKYLIGNTTKIDREANKKRVALWNEKYESQVVFCVVKKIVRYINEEEVAFSYKRSRLGMQMKIILTGIHVPF